MPEQRPQPSEYAPHQEQYVSLVPAPVLDALRAQEAQIRALPSRIDAERAAFRYQPGKWTAREVVGHMADAERVYQYRALALARGDGGNLPKYDPDGYVEQAGFESRTIADIAGEMMAVRQATLSLFANLPAEAWSRAGTLNGKPLSVRALAFIAAGHFARHVNVLRERYGIAL